MSKANRLLAAVLVVIMSMTMMTFTAFASSEKTFADDYEAAYVGEGVASPKNTAVIVTGKAKNKNKGDKVVVEWDGESWIFSAGVNAFDNYEDAYNAAEILADGGLPQILLSAGTYPELNITKEVQVFGTRWNTNPNVPDPTNPAAQWTLNPSWESDVTIVNDVIIGAGARGTIDIYGLQIIHRFYDCFRTVSAIPTILTLRNTYLYQTDTTTETLTGAANGRSYAKCAMTFWNLNSANTAESNKNNKDETYIVNLRVGKLNMDTSSSKDNRLIDERVSPTFVVDGFCADYENADINQIFWMKWQDTMTRTRCVFKNSYVNFLTTGSSKNDFAFEGFVNNKDTDTSKGEWAELIMENNVFCDNLFENGQPTVWIYQSEYDLVSVKNNMFISTSGTGSDLFYFPTTSTGNATDLVVMTDNMFLGYPKVELKIGSSDTKIDMTGSHIQNVYTTDYVNGSSAIVPTGTVGFDYCYVDGGRTIKTTEVQEFTVADAVRDDNNKTIDIAVDDGFFYKTPNITGLVTWEIYESDAGFSNYDDFSTSAKYERCVLKNKTNYFLLVIYSPDKTNHVIYKLTVTRPDPENLIIGGFDSTSDITVDSMVCTAQLDKDTDSLSFEPIVGEGVTYTIKNIETGDELVAGDDGKYSVTGLKRGEKHEYRIELAKGFERQYYTLVIKRPYNTACDIIAMDKDVTETSTGYVAYVDKGKKSFAFSLKVSEDASAYVWKGTNVYPLANGKITMSAAAGKYTLAVVAEDGTTVKSYPFVIKAVKSSAKEVVSVKGASKTADGFTAKVICDFTVVPTVSEGATYKIYADDSLEYEITDDPTVMVISEPVYAYIVVTAEDGSVSDPVKVTVARSDAGITIKGAEILQFAGSNIHYLELDPDVEAVDLKITAKDCTYQLYADPIYKCKATNKLQLDSATTVVYAIVTYNSGETEYDVIYVTSPRTPVKYKDAKSIPAWAEKYVTALNESGLGIFQGDEKGNFNPASSITRYEVAAVATRLLGVEVSQFASVKLTYKDSIAKWAENYVKAVTALGIMSGTTNAKGQIIFDGQNTTTRAQFANIIVDVTFHATGYSGKQYYKDWKEDVDKAFAKAKFADAKEIPGWAMESVKVAVEMELFSGSTENGKNYFKPNNAIKRQELAVVLTSHLDLLDSEE